MKTTLKDARLKQRRRHERPDPALEPTACRLQLMMFHSNLFVTIRLKCGMQTASKT
jgi:hypothetical protein